MARESTKGRRAIMVVALLAWMVGVVPQGLPTSTAPAAAASSRLSGPTRIDTAVAIAQHGFPAGAATVYLARADVFADALAAGALTDGPVLLVPSCGAVPPVVAAEVARLGPQRVVALGGQAAVCDQLLVDAAQGLPTGRLAGSSRIDTAVAISQDAFPNGAAEVYLARAEDSPDAVAGGVLTRGPILLVGAGDSLPDAVAQEIQRLGAGLVFALGGTGVISDQLLLAAAGAERGTARLAGASRVETAAEIARLQFPEHPAAVYLARADVFADAVAAGSLTDGPILLTPSCGELHPAVAAALARHAPDQVIALGGANAVCDDLLAAADAATGTGQSLDTVVPDTTEVLDEAASEALTSYDEASGTLVFDDPDGALAEAFVAGDVLATGPSSEAPYGLLRRVTTTTRDRQGGTTTITTEQAVLTDAVTQGSLRGSSPLGYDELVAAEPLVEGVTVGPAEGSRQAGSLGLSVTLPADLVVYDADGDDGTEIDQVRVTGALSLDIQLLAELDIDYRLIYTTCSVSRYGVTISVPCVIPQAYLNRFSTIIDGAETLDLDVTVGGTLELPDDLELTLATMDFGPQTVLLGPVPVVIHPVLEAKVGLDGHVSASVTVGAVQTFDLRAGATYTDADGWTPVAESDASLTPKPVTLNDVEAELRPYVRIPLVALFYDLAGPEIAIEPYLRLTARPLDCPLWQLFLGVVSDASMVLQVPVVGIELARFTAELFRAEHLLAEYPTDCDGTGPAGEGGSSVPREFGDTQGPVWFYGYGSSPGSLTQATWTDVVDPYGQQTYHFWGGGPRYYEIVGRDLGDWLDAGPGGWIQTGEGADAAIWWVAPEDGTVSVLAMLNTVHGDPATGGCWSGADCPTDDGVALSVWHDGQAVAPAGISNTNGGAFAFHGRNARARVPSATVNAADVAVAAGDTLVFYIDRLSWQDFDSVYYSFTVAYQDGDVQAPVSSHTLQGDAVTLTATDDGTVTRIEYLDPDVAGASWTEYSGPVTLPAGGRLLYRAVDEAGNIEPYHEA